MFKVKLEKTKRREKKNLRKTRQLNQPHLQQLFSLQTNKNVNFLHTLLHQNIEHTQ